jgi:exosortase H (IPTLxxWG-CTERM-specific)
MATTRGARRDRPAAQAARPGRVRRPMLRFAVTFALAAVALFAFYQWTEITGQFARVNTLNAQLCAWLLSAIGIPASRNGTSLLVQGGGMDVISECSAVYVAILFTAAVIAFPTTWRARARGVAVGLPVIFAVNQLRLVSLGVVLRFRASLLPLFHEYLWQVFFILVVTALYLLWIERMVPRGPARSAA